MFRPVSYRDKQILASSFYDLLITLKIMQDTKMPAQQGFSSSSPHLNPPPSLYRHTFFSSQGAATRKALIPGLVLPLVYNAILLWACISLFFGSLVQNNDVSKISVSVINLDDGLFGEGMMSGIREVLDSPGRHLQWSFSHEKTDPVTSDTWSRNLVLDEAVWAVLQINANASLNLQQALATGDAEYDPSSAITLYFASARNQVTTLSATVPAVMSLVNPIMARLAAVSTAESLEKMASNKSALLTGLQCAQCLASPFVVRQMDLIPFSSPVAFGTLNTGLIFVCSDTQTLSLISALTISSF
jgi:hypothetical protein